MSRLIFVLLLATAVSFAGIAHAKRPADAKIRGNHLLKVGGDFTGTGRINVKDKGVKFSLKLIDAAGKKIDVSDSEIEFGDGRFWGSLQIDGLDAEVSGRVDLPATGKSPRISGFIRVSDGRVARIANGIVAASDEPENPGHPSKPPGHDDDDDDD